MVRRGKKTDEKTDDLKTRQCMVRDWETYVRSVKNSKHQKYKGRVVLRGNIVKDDSGSYEVFTEHGSSASQKTDSKVMDIISRLSGCARQAADAVSTYIQVKWKMHRHC